MKKKRLAIGLLAISACLGLASCKDKKDPEPIVETEGYTVTFNANGHGTAPAAVENAKTIPTLTDLTADGWTFGGWYTDSACTKPATAGAALTENITLYAKWTENTTPQPVVKYSVTYEINGHGVQPEAVSDVTALPATLPVLVEEGWTFGGWYTDSACTIEATGGTAITANTTLYAKWTENVVPEVKYSVTYVINGHGTQPEVVSDVTALPTELPQLTEAGWTFGGWYTDELCTTVAEAGTAITANTTLYAKWTENLVPEVKYSVTYVINGHGTQPEVVSDVTALPTELPQLTEAGWTFDGWYTDELCTISAEAGATIHENTVLYAKWTEKSSYEKFLEQGNIYYQNDFSNVEESIVNLYSLSQQPSLGQLMGYVSAEPYTFNATNTVKIEDGKLKVLDSSADTTYGYIWLNFISYKRVSVYAELTPSANNGSWSLFNLVDERETEIASVRTISSGKLGFRANGVQSTEFITLNANDTIKVLINLDLLNSKVSFTYNGTLLGEADINSSVTTLAALKLITAGSASRDITIDNVAVRVEEYTVEELQTKLNATLDALYTSLNVDTNYTTNKEAVETAYTQGKTALSNAETAEAIFTAYANAVDAINAVESDATILLRETKEQALTQIETIRTENESNYTMEDNIDLFSRAIWQAQEAVTNATTVEAIQNAITGLNESLESIPTNAELLAEEKTKAISELQAYANAADYTINIEEFNSVISQAETGINAAEDTVEIQNILVNAKIAIDAIPTDATLIAEAKEQARATLTDYKATEIAEISAESFSAILEQIATAKETGLTNINNASTIDAVNTALTTAEENIDTLIASTQKSLEEVKNDAITELTTYANEKIEGYDETADAELIENINGLVSTYTESINNQETNAAVMQELSTAKSGIDELVEADSLAKAKNAAIEELGVFKDELVSQYYLDDAKNLFITEYITQFEILTAIEDITEVQPALETAKEELTALTSEAEEMELAAREDYETTVLADETTTADFAAYATEQGAGKTVAVGTVFGPLTLTTAGTTKTKLSSSECGLSVKSAVLTLTTTAANAKMTILYYSTSTGRTFSLTGPDGNPYGAGTSGTAGVYEASTWGKNVPYTIELGEAGEYNLTFDANEHKLTSIALTEKVEQPVTVKVNSLTAMLAEGITSQTAIADIISNVTLELDNEGSISNETITDGYTVSVKLDGVEVTDLTSLGEYEVTVVYGTSANKYNSYTTTLSITE